MQIKEQGSYFAICLRERKELVPEFDPRAGFRYPLAERLIAGSPSETQYVLRKLYEGGNSTQEVSGQSPCMPLVSVSGSHYQVSLSILQLLKHRTRK